MVAVNLNEEDYDPQYLPFFIKRYLEWIIPLYKEKYELRRDNRMLKKNKVELLFRVIDRKKTARKILKNRMNKNCIDNIMTFI